MAGAYRIGSCDGSTLSNVLVVAAAEMAYQDGMDIITLCAATRLLSQANLARAAASQLQI